MGRNELPPVYAKINLMKKVFILLTATAVILPLGLLLPVNNSKVSAPQVSSQEEEEEELIISGVIEAEKKVDLKFKTSGELVWVGIKKGDKVKKGQAIASLDKRELEKKFKKEMNDYLNERWDFEQTQDDYKETKDRHLITDAIQRILDKAQFDLDNSVLDLEIQKLAVEYSVIATPISGIVTHIDQPIAGVNITPATAVFTIADPTSVYFKAEADEEEVVRLKNGLKGKILLDAYLDQEFDSQIDSIDFAPILDKSGPNYAVKCALPENTDLRFRLGMRGEIEIKE